MVSMGSADVNMTAEPSATPTMVAERPQTTIPEGARGYFRPMLAEAMNSTKAEIRKEIGEEFDRSMNTNFKSLNKAMEDNKLAIKAFAENGMSEIIQIR